MYYSKDITHPNKVKTILSIFVNDSIVCLTNTAKLEDIIQYLDMIFKITCGDMEYYIGLEVYQNQQTTLTFLHQHRYIQQTLEQFGMADSYTVSTPTYPNVTLFLVPDTSEDT